MSASAESSLRIGGMHCAACADTVEAALRGVPGVIEARVSAAGQWASVRWDPERAQSSDLMAAVRAAGYEATPDTAAAARAARTREGRVALWRMAVALCCAIQIMMLTEPVYVSAPGEIAAEYLRLLQWGSWLLSLPVLLFAATPFLGGAWRSLRARRIGMDVPVALGVVVAFVASTSAAVDPHGPFGAEVYFDSLSMFVAFLLVGRFLEMKARHRAESALEDATSRLPTLVRRVEADGRVCEIPLEALRPQDLVRVPLGEAFPADGEVVDGETAADEALLTGESLPVPRGPGDAVVAGSLNVGAPVTVRALKVGADTRYEAIAALMRAARTARPALLAVADRWAAPFLWVVLALAAAAGVGWWFIDPTRVVGVVVAVLVVTCPCALSLAAPAALLASAGALGRGGLLLRNLDAIARLARVDTLFIDKTGTLTAGEPHLIARDPVGDGGGRSTDALTLVASSLAAWSTHPLSRALHAAWPSTGAGWQALQERPGLGLEGVDADGRAWRLGSADWVGADAVPGTLEVWLACEGRPCARFGFEEALREDARATVEALRADGLRVLLVSGDDPARAAALTARLPLDGAQGGLSPEGKLARLREAQQAGACVAMVGDGVNDAPVLAQADVSIAMGEGAQVARAQADAVLISNRLGDLVQARAQARRTLRVVRQNFAWAAIYNGVSVPLALAGTMPPWVAGLGMAASSLVVVGNSMRLARGR